MMEYHIPHGRDGKAIAQPARKFGRPNDLRKAQVMPPHNVDLTLAPAANADMYVPADISGNSLARRHAGDAGVAPRTRRS
ncbi:hypothetical protein [Rhizobium sp. HT1-10]|uniref:hypothetical protein n=1 Tax=Rhizobium sp. HT1-10 TaxID=3111638 RepID=UPI003C1B51D6